MTENYETLMGYLTRQPVLQVFFSVLAVTT